MKFLVIWKNVRQFELRMYFSKHKYLWSFTFDGIFQLGLELPVVYLLLWWLVLIYNQAIDDLILILYWHSNKTCICLHFNIMFCNLYTCFPQTRTSAGVKTFEFPATIWSCMILTHDYKFVDYRVGFIGTNIIIQDTYYNIK